MALLVSPFIEVDKNVGLIPVCRSAACLPACLPAWVVKSVNVGPLSGARATKTCFRFHSERRFPSRSSRSQMPLPTFTLRLSQVQVGCLILSSREAKYLMCCLNVKGMRTAT